MELGLGLGLGVGSGSGMGTACLAQRPLDEDRTEGVVDVPVERGHEDLGRAARTLGREGLVCWRARVQDRADKALAALLACGATVRSTLGTPVARVARTYSACASGTYSTQEAGTRSPYVQYGGSGTYVSAQLLAEVMALSAPATDAQVVSGQLLAAPGTAADRGGRRRLAAAHADYE